MAKNVAGKTPKGLWKHAARRTASLIPVLLISSFVLFLIMRALPGDVALTILSGSPHTEEMRMSLRNELGLNDPILYQYGRWLGSMFDGSFGGISLETKESIGMILARQLPVTALLALYASAIGIVIFLPLGVVAAYYQDRWPDYVIRFFTVGGFTLPHVLTANLILIALLIIFRWSPPIVYLPPFMDLQVHVEMMMWPSILLGWELGSHLARAARTGVLENLQKQHVLAARGRGISEVRVIVRYALRNALMPVATEWGIQIGTLLSGAIVLESIFGLPGIGRGLVGAALARDYPVVMSIGMLLIAGYLIISSVINVSHVILDPRTVRTNVSA